MERGASLAVLLLAAWLAVAGRAFGSAAGCARVLPSVEPSRAAPGGAFVLSGGGFGGGCDDSNLPFQPDPPQQDVHIERRQGGKAWSLATVDAGGPPNYRIEARLLVPKDAGPGKAVVLTRDDYGPMRVPFRVLGAGAG